MTAQLRRAAVSIAANIAEGAERQTTGEFRQFLGIAKGSLAEVETILLISQDLEYAKVEDVNRSLSGCREIGRVLNGLLNSLATDHPV